MFHRQQEQEKLNASLMPDNSKRELSVDAIPDLEKLTQDVLDFLEFYHDPRSKKLRQNNFPKYLNEMYNRFESMPESMIRLLSDEKNQKTNLTKMLKMFEDLASVKRGEKNIHDAEDEFNEKQNEEYFYPAVGGKDELIKIAEDHGHDVSEFKK